MPNRVHSFKDRDIKRIIRSAENATGKSAQRIEVDPRTGRVAVTVGGDAAAANSWDEVLSDAADQKRPA